MLGEWILKEIAFVVLGLLNLLGWKRAGDWLDKMWAKSTKKKSPWFEAAVADKTRDLTETQLYQTQKINFRKSVPEPPKKHTSK